MYNIKALKRLGVCQAPDKNTMKTVHAEEMMFEWITNWCKLVYGYRKDEQQESLFLKQTKKHQI